MQNWTLEGIPLLGSCATFLKYADIFHSFDVSPGQASLKEMYETNTTPAAQYQQFSSYPTAFIVAADVELSVSLPTQVLKHY
jgi:hypothetical protein